MSFEFRSHELKIRFPPAPGALKLIRTKLPARHDDLNLNSLLSDDEALVFQSPTGSTQVRIGVDSAELLTQYFDAYMQVDAWEQRREYAGRKLKAVLDLLDLGDISILFVGSVHIAKCPVRNDAVRGALKEWVTKKLNLGEAMTDGNVVNDFSIRASHVVDDKYFSNVSLNWYRQQTIQLQLARGGIGVSAPGIPDWEIPVTEEGIECRLDWNNKHSIYKGLKAFPREEVTKFLDQYFASIGRQFANATKGAVDHA